MSDRIYNKNQIVRTEITDINEEGNGIGKTDGYTLFVKDAVVGDIADVRITKPKKNYAFARLEKLIEPSSYRREAPCPIARACGGCQLQSLTYVKQLEYKANKVRMNLKRLGGFSEEELNRVFLPIVGADNEFRYRNKAQFPIGKDKDENPVAGFYAGRTHSIIPCDDCLLGAEENRIVLNTILGFMKKKDIPSYDEESGCGLVRHVLIRKSRENGDLMVCLIINGDNIPFESELVHELSKIKKVTTVSVNSNTERTNVILGDKMRIIYGSGRIIDSIRIYEDDLKSFSDRKVSFGISAKSFYQVNPLQTEKLYSLALSFAGLTGKETVWDLYCGIGTISLFLATKARKVYGVEIVPEAIEDAKENAKRNGIENATFYVGKAEEVLPSFYESVCADEDGKHPDVIVVDPPRKGCDEACLATMIKMAPERIVYVSCDSATLARDLRILCDGGYNLSKVCPVDQFCQTVHVESVCLLVNQNVKSKTVCKRWN